MDSYALRYDQWLKILRFLRAHPRVYVGNKEKCRRFIEGVRWMAHSGAQWRELPERYGKWNSVSKRFARWAERGVWRGLFEAIGEDVDLEHLLVDSTSIRAHPCAAGARKARGGQAAQALGRSRGGFTTKLHAAAEGLGTPAASP